MSGQAQGRKIAIIGSSGHVGRPTIEGLLAQGIHAITAVQRIEATSTFPPEVMVKSGDLKDESFLTSAFQGQDVVVLMPPLPQLVTLQEPASGAAGKVNTSSVAQTGQATAAVLSLPGQDLSRYKNKAFYVRSFHRTQKELLQAVQKATGTADQDWKIGYQDVNDALKDCDDKIQQKDATAPFVKFFLTHFWEGSGGDFESKVDASEVKKLHEIGLQEEAVDDVPKRTVS
ncbi:hypothetical protein ACJA88_012687 [Fusarium oxysporum]